MNLIFRLWERGLESGLTKDTGQLPTSTSFYWLQGKGPLPTSYFLLIHDIQQLRVNVKEGKKKKKCCELSTVILKKRRADHIVTSPIVCYRICKGFNLDPLLKFLSNKPLH